MRNFLVVVVVLLSLSSCDDGDIITVNLDFQDDLSRCENNDDSYLIYKTRTDPSESLSIVIPNNTTNDLLFSEPTTPNEPVIFTINGNTVRFIYRTYNRDITGTGTANELCNTIPPADLIVNEDYESESGTIEVTATIIDDDGDGISSLDEGADPNGDGDFSDAQNSDDDTIPDYLDQDDDNDNVLTINEIDTENQDGDDNPFTNPLDTDSDGIADYLDEDDDNDLVNTIFEDANGINGPIDDTSEQNGEFIRLYLNPNETTAYTPSPSSALENVYTRTVFTRFVVKQFGLDIILGDELDLGIVTTIIPIE